LTELGTWMKILQMVEASRMPPAKRTGSIESRFPMDSNIRAELIEGVEQILGPAADLFVDPPRISAEAFAQTVRDVTGQTPPPALMVALERDAFSSPTYPTSQIVVDAFVNLACKAALDTEKKKGRREEWSPPQAQKAIAELYQS